jgi:PAS domain S-box-containing protein
MPLLHASSARLAALLEFATAGAFEFEVDPDGTSRLIAGSGAFGQSADRSIPPDDRAIVRRATPQLLDNLPVEYEHRIIGSDKETRCLRVTAWPIWSEAEQRVSGFFGVAVDVTQHRHEEEQLRRLNRTLRAHSHSNQALLRAASEAAYLQEVCRIIVEDSGHAMVWVGLADDDEEKTVRPAACAGFEEGYLDTLKITWADTDRGRGPTGTAIRTGQAYICRNMQTDPRFLPWRDEALRRGYASSIALPLAGDGRVFGALTVYFREPDPLSEQEIELLTQLARDFAQGITVLRLRAARAQAEEALAQSEERYRRLVELSPDAIVVSRLETIEFVNAAAVRMLGASSPDQVIGRSRFDIFHPDFHAVVAERTAALLRGESTPYLEEKVVRLDGSAIDVEVAASPFRDRGGFAIQVVLRDITGRKRAEERLRTVNDRLIEADRRKDEFLSTLSHELRTPLNAIVGWSQMLLDPRMEPDAIRRGVQAIARNARAQTRLIDDLLDVSRIITGKMRLETTAFDLATAIHGAVDAIRPATTAKGVRLTVEILPDTMLVGDPDRLQQVFWNLLANAVKFTPPGGEVRVVSALVDSHVRVRVTDTGSGIAPEALPYVFERFRQFDRSIHPATAGLGLGLAIVRHLVEMHGGTVTAESEGEGRGATFTVRLPALSTASHGLRLD